MATTVNEDIWGMYFYHENIGPTLNTQYPKYFKRMPQASTKDLNATNFFFKLFITKALHLYYEGALRIPSALLYAMKI